MTNPLGSVLAALGWIGFAAVLTPVLLPPSPLYRTLVAGLAAILFFVALAFRRASFIAALTTVSAIGAAALALGGAEPAQSGAIVAAGYLAGSALRSAYESKPRNGGLLTVWRSLAAVATLSAGAALVKLVTSYLLVRGILGPRVVNSLGEDVSHAAAGTLAVLAALVIGCGFYRAASALEQDEKGRRAIDAALVVVALSAGFVNLLQKAGALPYFRAIRWEQWGRAQSIFVDPSAAGVAAAILLPPLLALIPAEGSFRRVVSATGAILLFVLIGDAGSRAGFIGVALAGIFFIAAVLARIASGEHAEKRKKLARVFGVMIILFGAGLSIALAVPASGQKRSILLSRLEQSFSSDAPPEVVSRRLLLYEAAFHLFQRNPVAGGGLGSFRFEFPDVSRDELAKPVSSSDNPPSLYLGILAEMGLAGGIMMGLLLLGVGRGIGGGLAFDGYRPGEAMSAAAAAASLLALIVIFLFGSHLLYAEVAAVTGVLAARLTIPEDGRTHRFLHAVTPVALAGTLVLLAGGVLSRAAETSGPESAFRHSADAGVYPPEAEPDGRVFRWTSYGCAFQVRDNGGDAVFRLQVRNARPDGQTVELTLFWNDAPAGVVVLPPGPWQVLECPIRGSGVLRVRLSDVFRPADRRDRRLLGIEVGEKFEIVKRPGR